MAKKPESKDLRKLRALIEQRADKVMDPARPGFNAADILGITLPTPTHESEFHPQLDTPKGVDTTHMDGTHTPMAGATPGEEPHTIVVVNSNNNTTTRAGHHTPGLDTPKGVDTTHMDGTHTHSDETVPEMSARESDLLEASAPRLAPDIHMAGPSTATGVVDAPRGVCTTHIGVPHTVSGGMIPPESALLALRLGRGLAAKAVAVLMTLDRYRSVINPSYTVPIGYSQLADKAGINAHYLRRAVLPTLALRGLIAIAAKGFDGTVYQLRCDHRVIELIVAATTQMHDAELPSNRSPELAHQHDSAPPPSSLPDWVNREKWGTLAPDTVQRLIDRAGSEEQAREVLEIIVYNEAHGPERSRVRNRLSVLSRYLSSPNAEVWSNDDGYETLSLRRARLERDRAAKEKALAEEALKARQEERLLRFRAALTEAQWAWIRSEAKRIVDSAPKAQQELMGPRTRLTLYKAKEDELIREWLDRTAYGESVPEQA